MTTGHCAHWATEMSDRTAGDRAWVLHRRPYRNTSLIVEFLTATGGRLAAVARSGRKQPHLQPFQPLTVFVGGRGELRSLKNAEPAGSAMTLKGEALYCGLYLNELLVRMLHRDDPQPGLADEYEQALARLRADDWPRDLVLRQFEQSLLQMLGYGLSLEQDVQGVPIDAGQHYRLIPDEGLLADSNGRYPGAGLLALAQGDWQHEDSRRLARDLMREALAPHLGDKPLISRQLFRQAGAGKQAGNHSGEQS